MAERLRGMSDEQLEAALRDVGQRLAYPEPDLAAIVAEHLDRRVRTGAAAREPLLERLFPRRPVRRLAVVVLILLVLLAAAAVAGSLGVPGLRIIFKPGATLPSPPPVGTHLFLGTRTTLPDARRKVDFPVSVPYARGFSSPEVYVSSYPPGGRVSLVYRAGPGLPAGRFTGVGALVTEFRGGVDPVFIKKLVLGGGNVQPVQVGGEPAFWFSGNPHELLFLDEHGRPFQQSVRLAGNTLVWTRGLVTLRLECRCSEARALAIATSFR